jgi:hypothetical protein
MTPAGRYYHISPRFWQDPRVRAWSEDGRTLALYLRTSPHGNMVGLYYCPLPYMTADLQWDEGRLQAALDELVAAGYAHYDYESRVVLVTDALVDDPPQNPNQVKGAVAIVGQLPPTPLQETLIEIADRACPALAEALRNGFETVLKGLRNGFETVSEGFVEGSETVSNTEPDSRTRFPVPGTHTRGVREKDPQGEEIVLPTKPERVVELWNDLCSPPLPRVSRLTDDRRRRLKARLSERSRDQPPRDEVWWQAYFRRIVASPFCRGDGSRGWVADFDWAIRSETVVARVLEGKYDGGGVNREPLSGRDSGRDAGHSVPATGPERARLRRLDIGIVRPDGSRAEGVAGPE